jgi:ligand-binding sensor domain-containing protein/signal transduction histidine kinase
MRFVLEIPSNGRLAHLDAGISPECVYNPVHRMRLLCAVSLVAALAASAEQPAMRLFTTEDGLVRNWVNRIRRDSRGRLWFCTVEGLSLFDGRRFANYTQRDGLPHRLVNDIAEAGDGTYWLATGAGLYRFRPRAVEPTSFEPVPLQSGAPQAANVVLRTAGGEVWCAAEKGLYRIEGGVQPRGAAVPLLRPPAFAKEPVIYALTESGGTLWIGNDAGVVRRRADGAMTLFPMYDGAVWAAARREGARMPASRALMVDRDGVLWAGGWGGFCTLDTRRDAPPVVCHPSPAEPNPLSDIHAFLQDRNGGVWVAGLGLAYVRPGGRPQGFDSASPLGSQHIGSPVEDAEGHLWAAVSNLGVARLAWPGASRFTEADGLESTKIHAVFESHDGTLYAVSGEGHALNRFDGRRFSAIRPRGPVPPGPAFGYGERAVTLQDRHGEWWIATGVGLLRYPRVAKPADLAHTNPRAFYREADGLPQASITRVFEDSRGDIWIGTAFGAARWISSTERIQNLNPQLQAVLGHVPGLHSFAEDATGAIWLGFHTGGVVRFRGGRFEAIAGVPAGMINDLLADHAGRLWVASSQGGLARSDEPGAAAPHFYVYTESAGLRSRHIFALAQDRRRRVYVAGGQGVDRLDPATGAVEHYSAGSGLPPGEVQRLHTDRQGAVWFASHFGLSRFDDDSPGPESAAASPEIREIRVAGVPVLISDEGESHVGPLSFPSGKDSIEIAFGTVDFSIGDRARYRYRLAPVDREWRQPTAARSAQYAGIGPGSYRFEVQTVSATGLPGAGTASVEFRIRPPFWATWWFLMLAGGFATALVFAARLNRMRHLLALERVRARLAADLHDDLGAGLVEIAVLTEVARQRESTEQLAVVAERARELRRTMRDIVWSVDPECDNLEGLIRRWRETAFALLANEVVDFAAPPVEETARIELSPERRRHLLLIFKEVIANAACHAQGCRVHIEVALMAEGVSLEVRDDGPGFVVERAESGNGLRNIAGRAAAMGARVEIDSRPGAGTVVRLSAPFTAC